MPEYSAYSVWCALILLAGLAGALTLWRRQTQSKKSAVAAARWQSFFGSNLAPLACFNQLGTAIDVNPLFLSIFEYDEAEARAGHLTLDTLKFDQMAKTLFTDVKTNQKDAVLDFETNLYTKNGAQVRVQLSMVPLHEDNGGVLLAVNDVTQQRSTEKESKAHLKAVEGSNLELERFAYIASHDLQEPLRMIASYTQLLEKRYRDKFDSDGKEFMDYIVNGAKRMQALINDLLTLSKVGHSGDAIEKSAVPMSTVFKQALHSLQFAIQDSDAVISFHAQDAIVHGNKVLLVQLLQNLIGNSLKFRSPSQPKIELCAELQGSEWLFKLSDNGIGFSMEFADRIFVLFQRLHTQDAFPGTGLGLTMAKRIVSLHGGKIWVESKQESGSTFYFTLPAQQKDTQ